MITIEELKQYLNISGNDQVASITITNQGAGYDSIPNVVFTGGGGTGAAGTAVVEAGKVTSVTITNAGSGYTQTPTVAFTGGTPETTALGTVNMGSPFLQSSVDQAISAVNQYCNRDFRVGEYTEYFRPIDNVIHVSNYPLNSVSEIESLDESDNTYEDIITAPDTIADSILINSSKGRLQLLKDYTFPEKQIRITYNGGYTTAPAEIKGICLEMAALYHANAAAGQGRLGLSSQNVGGQSSTGMSFNQQEFYDRHKEQLDKYRNWNV